MCCFAVPGHGWVPGRAPNVLFCCAGLRSGARKSSKCAVLLCRATCGAQEELQMCCFAVPGYVWGPGRAPNVLFCCAGLRLFGAQEELQARCFAVPGQVWELRRVPHVLFCCAWPGLGPRKSCKCAVLLCRAWLGAQEELQMCCFAVPGWVWGPGGFQMCCFAAPGYVWEPLRVQMCCFAVPG